MQPNLSPVTHRVFGPLFARVPLGPVPAPEVRPPAAEAIRIDREFIALLRANLRAAGKHAVMGHEGPSFRECSHAECRDAVKLIPPLEEVDLGATDAELGEIIDRVLAALEEGLPEVPAPRTGEARGGTSWTALMTK